MKTITPGWRRTAEQLFWRAFFAVFRTVPGYPNARQVAWVFFQSNPEDRLDAVSAFSVEGIYAIDRLGGVRRFVPLVLATMADETRASVQQRFATPERPEPTERELGGALIAVAAAAGYRLPVE